MVTSRRSMDFKDLEKYALKLTSIYQKVIGIYRTDNKLYVVEIQLYRSPPSFRPMLILVSQ